MPYAANNNPSQPKNFETLIACMKFLAPHATFRMAETYLDYGAGMKWTTILAAGPDGNKYQMLNSAEWDALDLTDDLLSITQMAGEVYRRQIRMLDPANAPKLLNWVVTYERANGTIGKADMTAIDEAAARRDFQVCYRHGFARILSVQPWTSGLRMKI